MLWEAENETKIFVQVLKELNGRCDGWEKSWKVGFSSGECHETWHVQKGTRCICLPALFLRHFTFVSPLYSQISAITWQNQFLIR